MPTDDFETYEAIRDWRDYELTVKKFNQVQLNNFHDEVMRATFHYAVRRLGEKPPSGFAWFITGSGGREEQGYISDQDHGIIYEEKGTTLQRYFHQLGKELAHGLNIVGYPYCDGNIMSSNPLWCKSQPEWFEQLQSWLDEKSWATMRHLQIFFDARVLVGESEYINHLKKSVHEAVQKNPHSLKRLLDNIQHIKTSIGPLGQILTENHGSHKGEINIKYAAFLPFVNGIRLLSIKEGIVESSTLSRLERLMCKEPYKHVLLPYHHDFQQLLKLRHSLLTHMSTYEDGHYLNVRNMNRKEKSKIKVILKNGRRLHQYVEDVIEQEVK
ncbi:DUF294 nucleotidyltransferase-like domain-containing protein [Cytobacillus kochii]|uniref:DUF294 nucleotidyltransferase-like domain-containing protein n=1 Tax=Cytobacillus kochii TaxID=859143 RepID=UPI00248171CC|nr:DUF294 nucleotidyltransferase-like domain-containing protein [Cytobacillus kochii]